MLTLAKLPDAREGNAHPRYPWCIVFNLALTPPNSTATELAYEHDEAAAWPAADAFPRIEGEPSRISMCHCLECQSRAAVASPATRWSFPREQVTFAGKSSRCGN